MEKITMITTAFNAALATALCGGAAGFVDARGRIRVTEPTSALVSDPCPAGPLV